MNVGRFVCVCCIDGGMEYVPWNGRKDGQINGWMDGWMDVVHPRICKQGVVGCDGCVNSLRRISGTVRTANRLIFVGVIDRLVS